MDSVNEEPFDFSLQLTSLKELALIRVSRILWRTPEMIKSLDRSDEGVPLNPFKRYDYPDEPTVKELLKKISLLPLPEHFKKQVIPLIYHVGREIRDWIKLYHNVFVKLGDRELLRNWKRKIVNDFLTSDRIRWTAYGTIDTVEMARMLVHHPVLPIEARYDFSCQFCMEDDIQRLWTKLEPEDGKTIRIAFSISTNYNDLRNYWSFQDRTRINYWKSPENVLNLKFCPTYNFVFSCFWPKLTDAEKNRVRYTIKSREGMFETKIFLLNTIDRQQQDEFLLELDHRDFLPKLLKRPWQHLFFPVLDVLKGNFNSRSFYLFLRSANLLECDDSTRHKFYSVLRPLIHEYLNEIVTNLVIDCYDLERNQIEHAKELMKYAPLWQKCDFITQVVPRIRPQSTVLNRVMVLVLEWLTSDTWSTLRNLLTKKMGKEKLEKIKDFFEYLDDHFANNRANEVDNSAHSSKKLKIFDEIHFIS